MRILHLGIVVQLLCVLGFKVMYCRNRIAVSPKHGKSVPAVRVVTDILRFTLPPRKGLWFKIK
jgi:hypothetical protein